MPADKDVLIALRDVCLAYERGAQPIGVLENVSLSITRGETCAIVGRSGSGKTTLMNVLGLLDRPTSGSYRFKDLETARAAPDRLAVIRNRDIGFVFQAFNLLPRLTALDNVALPLFYRGMGRRERRARALEQLRSVGLADRAQHRPAELSGGQCQRVAIARALITDPALILADEPTGNLDRLATEEILQLLFELNARAGITLVTVTHDLSIAARCDRQIEVREGGVHEASAKAEAVDA